MKLSRPSALAGAASLASLVAVGAATGVALSSVAAPAYAAAGGLDPTFGTGGTVTTSTHYIGSVSSAMTTILPLGWIRTADGGADPM